MTSLSRTGILICSVISLIALNGCVAIAIPAIHLIQAGDGEKNVSSDPQRGFIVGKDYELLQDLYLSQYIHSDMMDLSSAQIYKVKYKDGVRISKPHKEFPLIKIVPKGTRFRTCAVIIHTNYGCEGNLKKILAYFIDEKGNLIEQKNLKGKIMPFEVEFLFHTISLEKHTTWDIQPKDNVIKEISINN